MTLFKKPFENIVGKGENAGNQHFLRFPPCFLLFPRQILIFQSHLFCRLQMLPIWTSLEFCCVVKSFCFEFHKICCLPTLWIRTRLVKSKLTNLILMTSWWSISLVPEWQFVELYSNELKLFKTLLRRDFPVKPSSRSICAQIWLGNSQFVLRASHHYVEESLRMNTNLYQLTSLVVCNIYWGYLGFFFWWKIEIYFIECTPSVIFSRVAKPRGKILPMVVTRWNKFRSFTENNKYSVYFMLLTLSGRSFIKIKYSSFPLFPVAYPFGIATCYNITSSAWNVR